MSFDENNSDEAREELDEHLPYTRPRLRMNSLIDQYGIIPPRKSPKARAKDFFARFWNSFDYIDVLNTALDCIPLIRVLKEYKIRKYLLRDILAGFTTSIVHIPQGIAYGVLASLSATQGRFLYERKYRALRYNFSPGLLVSFFPVVLYMIFGTSAHLSIGTNAISSILVAKAIDGIPIDLSLSSINGSSLGSNMTNISSSDILREKVGIAATLAFLVGIIQIIIWALRLGFITTYMTEPFVSGLNVGAAIQVVSTQIPTAFGVPSPKNIQGFFKLPRFYVKVIGSIFSVINWVSTGITIATVIIIYVVKKYNEKYRKKIRIIIPIELLIVIVGTLASYLGKFHAQYGVAIVGPITKGLPAPTAPTFHGVSDLLVPAFTITLVTMCLNISMAKLIARKYNYKIKSNQESLAYGMGNFIGSFFQCFPSSASLSRSMVQGESGGKTILIGGFSSTVLLIVLLVLAPALEHLPMPCLSGIIFVNLKGLLMRVTDFNYYYRISLLEAVIWSITFGTVVLSDVDIGVYVGLATSLLINTIRTQRPHFIVLGRVGDTMFYKNVKIFPSAEQHINIKILRFDGSLYACNAPFFKRKFYEHVGIQVGQKPLISFKKPEEVEIETKEDKYVVLDCSPMNFIDSVGVKLLMEIYGDMKKRNIFLYFSECRFDVRSTMDTMKFFETTNPHIIYVSTHDAVQAILEEIKNSNSKN